MLERLLSAEQQEILRKERSLLEDTRVYLARLDTSDEQMALLKRSIEQLDELFLLVIVGEFNAGKTAFLNALLGRKLLPEGVTPTTAHIHLLRYGEQMTHETVGEDYIVVHLPVEWLREINLVDTPGTNAVVQRHQQITERFIPQSDLVLFVTSADRPFSESERAFLERIRQWGKKVVIVVNKIDIVQSDEDRRTILQFVRENAQQLLGVEPQVFPVSARAAQAARFVENGAGVARQPDPPDFAALESYLLGKLDAAGRMRLKLENPLGVAQRLLDSAGAQLENRQGLLKADFETLDAIDAQLVAYEQDMRRDFQFQASRVDNVLFEMIERGDKFFDDTLRLGRIFDLMNGQKLSAEFDRLVLADTSRQIERHVNELIDWMVDKDFRQWRATNEFLNRRWQQHADNIVGSVGADFDLSRRTLLDAVGREAQRIIESYDRESEAAQLTADVQRSIVATAAVEAGAIGLGAILVVALHGALLDVTGILGAGVVAALGFYLLPYRRQQMKADLRTRISTLRGRLHEALQKQFDRELESGIQRIREAIAPYTRFVRVERDKLLR
ncbi:MAG: dynamin family protein, partial [Caldilineaceae bacterium]